MRLRYKNKRTGVRYKTVEPLFYFPALAYCITTFGRREYVSMDNLEGW